MSLDDEIRSAIGAHNAWKLRLRTAIDGGKVDGKIADVAKDNVCSFGRWLYGSTIPQAARTSADYTAVRQLHAQFHKCAAKVLELVSQGKKPLAEALLASDGEYTRISSELTAAMMKWSQATQKL